MAFWKRKREKSTRNRLIKIKVWFHDGRDWLEYGVGWNLFPLLVAILLFVAGRAKTPFITAAGTYSMAIFSISSSAIGNAKKLGVHHGLVEFARILSVLLYVLLFSDFVSPVMVSGIDMSVVGQIVFLLFLSLLLLYIINFGVKLDRASYQASSSNQEQATEQTAEQNPVEEQTPAGGHSPAGGQRHPQEKELRNPNRSKKKRGNRKK